MLILTRRTNETVCIGKNIRVTVLAVRGRSARLGFEAPRDCSIFREELLDDQEGAAASSGDDEPTQNEDHLANRGKSASTN